VEEHLSLLESKLKEQFQDSEQLLQQLRNVINEQREFPALTDLITSISVCGSYLPSDIMLSV